MRRTYYRVCEYCGSTLDAQEKCDCQEERMNMSDKVVSLDEKKKVSLKEYKDTTEILTYAVINLQAIIDDLITTNHLELSGVYESAFTMKARADKEKSSIYMKN